MMVAQGTHILQQVGTLAQARGFEGAIRAALAKMPLTTLCFRVPWNSPEWEAIHDYGATLATTLGIGYAPRSMAGRTTPTAVLDAGPSYTWSGTDMGGRPVGPYRLPLPCNPDGTPNAGFEEAFVEAALIQDRYATEVNHLWAYGRLWAEVDFGAQPGDVLSQPGNSMTNVVRAHVRLYDLARAALPGRIIEFPLSGHGPATAYITAVTDKAIANADRLVYFQMNGLQELGVMWTPNMTGVQPPPSWCAKPVNRAFQAFDTKPDHDWEAVYDRVEAARDAYTGPVDLLPTYVELYLATSLQVAPAQMVTEVRAYDVPAVPDDCEQQLAAALARVATLERDVLALSADRDALTSQVASLADKLERVRQIVGP